MFFLVLRWVVGLNGVIFNVIVCFFGKLFGFGDIVCLCVFVFVV